jgi:hypothetical protein
VDGAARDEEVAEAAADAVDAAALAADGAADGASGAVAGADEDLDLVVEIVCAPFFIKSVD